MGVSRTGIGGAFVHDQLVFALSLILRERREALDVSQSDLARRSGLHRSYIGDLERGSRNISVKNLSRLSEALEVPASKILGLAEKRMASDGPYKLKKRKPVAQAKTTAKAGKAAKPAAKPTAKPGLKRKVAVK
jgi:transcriptional regulator with XRE-family HTH domain